MTSNEATEHISSGEGQNIEFKESLAPNKKILATLAAFGSQSNGGMVFIGVKDNGTIRKFDIGKNTIENLANDIKRNVLSLTTAKPLLPEIHFFEKQGFLAIWVTPDQSKAGPYIAFGDIYTRSGKATLKKDMDYPALAKAFRKHLYEDNEVYPPKFRFCPECGSKNIEHKGSVIDGDLYANVKCSTCGWIQDF